MSVGEPDYDFFYHKVLWWYTKYTFARGLHRLELSLYILVIYQIYVYVPVSALREHPLGCDLHEPLSNSSICSENQNSWFWDFVLVSALKMMRTEENDYKYLQLILFHPGTNHHKLLDKAQDVRPENCLIMPVILTVVTFSVWDANNSITPINFDENNENITAKEFVKSPNPLSISHKRYCSYRLTLLRSIILAKY